MKLIPEVKKLLIKSGFLCKNSIAPYTATTDHRLKKAIDKLPASPDGAALTINCGQGSSDEYAIDIEHDKIVVTSESVKGAFYAIQTLRQIFRDEKIPCLHIADEPDFEYRGLYQDLTRGKIAKVETLKKLIDQMAYFKMNSLQLYVEHVFEFEETKDLIGKTGYITKEEIKELDIYCSDNFIEFIPSIATFGHMYEILQQEKYHHLRVLKDYENSANFWLSRMRHHTIDPQNDESIELVKSLIDQYYPLFETDKFNICADETFDLEASFGPKDAGRLYLDFVRKIIEHVNSRGKKVMMWADILIHHPEITDSLPDDIYYLNWDYSPNPPEEKITSLSKLGKRQIVCPGTGSWSRFCENTSDGVANIVNMIDYGYKYKAAGVLNTNWGDYANPASIDLAMFGIVLGAAKSWRAKTTTDKDYIDAVDSLLYGKEGASEYLFKLSNAQSFVETNWNGFCAKYFECRFGEKTEPEYEITKDQIEEIQKLCTGVIKELCDQSWEEDEARQEMIICAMGICVMAQLGGKMTGIDVKTAIETKDWLERFSEKWLLKNKPSELSKIEEMFLYIDAM